MQRSLLFAVFSFGVSSCGAAVEERPARAPRPVVAVELTWTDPVVELELTGVVEHGLFVDMADKAIIGTRDGIRILVRPD